MRHRFALALLCLVALSCDRNDPKVEDTFDKEAMLKNITSTSIVPAYSQWAEAAGSLDQAADVFTNDPSEGNLEILRNAFIKAHENWNACALFEFGPAADRNLRLAINTFPTDTAQIETNIVEGDYDLDAAMNADAKGFAAIDYVLYTKKEALLSSDARAKYIKDNTQYILGLANEVESSWQSYQNEFANNTSSSAGSSISNLVNEINYEFELIKNARVGIPLGKKTLGETQVEKLEGFYSGKSNEFAVSSLISIKNAFTGGNGIGLDDYLNDLDAKKDDKLLSIAIIELFDEIETGLNEVELRSTIDESPADLDPIYNKLEQQVVLLKTDMPSQLGVQITYQDNDGD